MIIDLILFSIFIVFIRALGAGSAQLIDYKSNHVYPDYFYLILGLLTIGFISALVNFYSGVDSYVTYSIIAFLFVAGCRNMWKTGAKNLKYTLLFAAVITPFVTIITAGYDTGLYHIPHQLWIRNEKIIFGLANFHGRFGFSSIMEYINASLWVHENFNLLAYSQASFVVILLLFLKDMLNSDNHQFRSAGLLLTTSLLLYGIQLRTDYTSTDIPTGIMFTIAFLNGLRLLLKSEPPDGYDIFVLLICGLFTAVLKANGILISLWILYVLANLLQSKLIKWEMIGKAAVIPIILGIIWLAHSIIISGCLLFPVKQTCLYLPWSAYDEADGNAKWVTAWARNPHAGLKTLDNWDWISDWWLKHDTLLAALVFLTVTICFAYKIAFRIKIPYQKNILIPAFVFIVLNIAIWFVKSPNPRFGIGVFMVLPTVTALLLFGFRKSTNEKWVAGISKICLSVLACEFAVIGIVNMGWDFSFYPLRIGYTETVPADHFGVKPVGENADQCWLAKNCTPNDRADLIEKDGIKMFISTLK